MIGYLSIRAALIDVVMEDCWASPSLKILSMTDNSVLVVSNPQNEHQSLTTIPAPTTSLPRFIVPAFQKRECEMSKIFLMWNLIPVLHILYKHWQ